MKLIFGFFPLFPLLVNGQNIENKRHKKHFGTIAHSQSINHSKNVFLLGFDILPGNKTTSPRWRVSYERRLTSSISGGIGVGFTYYNDPLSLLPVFVIVKYRFLQTPVFPFIAIKAGHNFSLLTHTKTLVDNHSGDFLFNPAVGIHIPLKRGCALYFSVGYNIDKASFSYKFYRNVTTNITYKRFMAGIGLIF
jgi:hypothetical protein